MSSSEFNSEFGCTPAQYHNGLDKLWDALAVDGPQEEDCFTLAANEIKRLRASKPQPVPQSFTYDEVVMLQFIAMCQHSLDPGRYEDLMDTCEYLCVIRCTLEKNSLEKVLSYLLGNMVCQSGLSESGEKDGQPPAAPSTAGGLASGATHSKLPGNSNSLWT